MPSLPKADADNKSLTSIARACGLALPEAMEELPPDLCFSFIRCYHTEAEHYIRANLKWRATLPYKVNTILDQVPPRRELYESMYAAGPVRHFVHQRRAHM